MILYKWFQLITLLVIALFGTTAEAAMSNITWSEKIMYFLQKKPLTQKSTSHSWYQQELEEDRQFRSQYQALILKTFWEKCVLDPKRKDSVVMVKNILLSMNPDPQWATQVEEVFVKNDFDGFEKLFEHTPVWLLKAMNREEKLGNITKYEEKQLEIKSEIKIESSDLQDLKQYMDERQLPAMVLLGSAKTGQFVTPNDEKEQLDVPFAIHSVGKVFTGVLTLLMIEQGIIPESKLNQPIEIDVDLKKSFPPEVQVHLNKVTLHQAMTHMAGFKDYLGEYEKAINTALEKNEHVPKMEKIEDFIPLAFPKDKKSELGAPGIQSYSNTRNTTCWPCNSTCLRNV